MKYYVENSLSNFHFWSGAEDRAAVLTDDQFEVVEQNMEECEPEGGWSDTAINDLFWFEFDTIAQWLGYKDEEYLMEDVSDDDIFDAEDWFEKIDDVNELIALADLDAKEYVMEDENGYDVPDELDEELVNDDAQDWWNNLEDIDKVRIFRKNDK